MDSLTTKEYYEVDSKKKIYPVLILSDYKYVLYGLTNIANKWYREDLGCTYNSSLDRPLIIMSFITLIKYGNLFKRHGFEYYFERYYKTVNMIPIINVDTAKMANQSFDEYMSKYPFNLTELSDELGKVITFDRDKN